MMEPSQQNFYHPYTPYDIQIEFMRNLYHCLEHGKVGIFESPTGTGKSLSLICGALTWLRDHARQKAENSLTNDAGDPPDWLAAAERASQHRELIREREQEEQRLASLRSKELARRNAQGELRLTKKPKLAASVTHANQKSPDEEFMLDDYESDNEAKSGGSLSLSTQALLDKLKPIMYDDEEEEEESDRTKIIFCSRTHSQLTQFVHELTKVKPPPGLPYDGLSGDTKQLEESVKHLSLGSRKNLCINPKVSRLSSTMAINERCLEIQKPNTAKEHKCQYLPRKEDRNRVESFRDRALATIRDIEDTADLGRQMELCPYYASRSAISRSEVLTLPYPLLLQKSARDALGVEVKGNIIVIDEAHNLMDAIADTLSVSLSLSHLELATMQLTAYVQRFKARLKGQNRMYITQVIRLLNSLTRCLQSVQTESKPAETSVTAGQLMAGKGVDQIKPHKLLEYLVESKLGHKVEGYTEAQEKIAHTTRPKGVLIQFQNFLAALMNPDSEGRFFVLKEDTDIIVRYTLLDPREHFRDVVENARAVVLAGGTMSPMSDYVDYLFSYLDTDRLETFSFGHIVPKDNIFAQPIMTGPTGIQFDFTFGKRNNEIMVMELGLLLHRICLTVPDGVVVFFPSYDYLAYVLSIWKKQDTVRSIFDKLALSKQIFEESKGILVDELLRDYASAIDQNKGGLMLSVVGGRLSEGINFSNRLGRAVVAVGLPYPNMHGAEWKAKIEHVEATKYNQCRERKISEGESRSLAQMAGRGFYENACMRAVNQSIGRAIRHKGDYAAIILTDRRFGTERIKNKLPQWIQSSMRNDQTNQQWVMTERDLEAFFRSRDGLR